MHAPDDVSAVLSLATRLGIGLGEACDHAGIARSNPSRWRKGTEPQPQILRRLHLAIIEIARKRGVLNFGVTPNASEVDPDTRRMVLLELQSIRDSIARIDAMLGTESGV